MTAASRILSRPADIDPRVRRLARKARRQDNKRQIILRGAREILLRHGPLAFTMDQVANAADTSKATLYYYFRSREEMIGALAIDVLRREVEALSAAVSAADSGVDALAALVRARVAHYMAEPDDFRILYLWAPMLDDPQRLLLAEVHALTAVVNTTVEAKLARDRKAGLLHPDAHPQQLAQLGWLTAHGLLSFTLGSARAAAEPTSSLLSWRELCDAACATLLRAAHASAP
jgi:TetR/AcrR family transcriptional regulator